MKTPKMTISEAYDKVHAIMSQAKNGEYAARRVEKIMSGFLPPEFVAQWKAVAIRKAAENVRYAADMKKVYRNIKIS